MLNPQRVLADIDAVFLQFPDISAEEELKTYVLEHGTDFRQFLEYCLNQIRTTEADIHGVDWRMDQLSERKERLTRRVDSLRALMQKAMEHAQTTKYTLPEATLSLSQRPTQVIITDEGALPQEYKRIKWEPAKSAIKKALLEGATIPGAILSNGGIGLTVRTK